MKKTESKDNQLMSKGKVEAVNSLERNIIAPIQEKQKIPEPDPSISAKEMQDYGYSWEGMLPLHKEAAERLFMQGSMELFRLYNDDTESVIDSLLDLREHGEYGGLFGVEKDTWEICYRKLQQQENKSEEEGSLPNDGKNTYEIYQLIDSGKTRELCFIPYALLQATGKTVDRTNYRLVYTAPLTADITLEGIWEKFNLDHPDDFDGHSLSVSDIVILHQNGKDTAYYVDIFGFMELPEFF